MIDKVLEPPPLATMAPAPVDDVPGFAARVMIHRLVRGREQILLHFCSFSAIEGLVVREQG